MSTLSQCFVSSLIAHSSHQDGSLHAITCSEGHQRDHWIFCTYISSICREQHVPVSWHHSHYLLHEGSIRLSVLNTSFTNDLHVYHCKPPPQVPLTLILALIVDHLSGPNTCPLTETTVKITFGCTCTDPSLQVYCACKFNTKKLANMKDSLVRVSRRFENGTTTTNCRCHNWAFERNLFVNHQMPEHTHTESECDLRKTTSILVLTDKVRKTEILK